MSAVKKGPEEGSVHVSLREDIRQDSPIDEPTPSGPASGPKRDIRARTELGFGETLVSVKEHQKTIRENADLRIKLDAMNRQAIENSVLKDAELQESAQRVQELESLLHTIKKMLEIDRRPEAQEYIDLLNNGGIE